MQHYFIYPEAKATKTNLLLIEKGYSENDFESQKELAQNLETEIKNIGCTLISCDWRTKGQLATVWNIRISTPGQCDIFKLLEALRNTFDLNGIDDKFTFINTDYCNKQVYLEFIHEA